MKRDVPNGSRDVKSAKRDVKSAESDVKGFKRDVKLPKLDIKSLIFAVNGERIDVPNQIGEALSGSKHQTPTHLRLRSTSRPVFRVSSSMKGWIAVVVCVVLASCRTPEPVVEASPAAPPVPLTVEELITSLGHLEEVSDGRVAVNPGLSALCRGHSTEEIAEARKEFGPHALAFIRVSMNERAASAFASGKSYPVGSAVIKFKDAAVSGGIGGMIKREPGYDERRLGVLLR